MTPSGAKPCLADVNVWLALLVAHHEHHRRAREWYAGLAAGQTAIPRFVQLSIVRLLCNPKIMGSYAITASVGWKHVCELLEDERVDFLTEPEALEAVFTGLLRYPVPTPKLLNDAYLAALAIGSKRQLVTLDSGFSQFRGLDLRIL
jgi:uncharacterized protein